MYARDPYPGDPIIHRGRKSGPVYCTDIRKHIDAMLVLDMLHCIGPREPAPHPQFHVLTCVEARTTAAAKRLLADGILRHLIEVIAYVPDNIARLLKKSHTPCRIAGIMVG